MDESKRLRVMLDESGIEYTANDEEHVKETCWPYMGELMAAFAEYDNGTTRFACDTWCFTPEQAIAATVTTEPDEATMLKLHSRMNAALLDMQEELLAYHPQDRENASSKELIDCVIRAHQIIEDAATGVGTCVDKDSDPNDFKCSACGARSFIQANDTYTTILDDHLTVLKKFNYCPNCGKRIIEEDTE